MTSSTEHPGLSDDVVATAMVAAFSMTVAVGFARVFTGWPFLGDMAVIVAAGHGAGLVLRRLRLTPWIAVPATAAVLVWTVLAVFYPQTFSWALPTGETWSLVQSELTAVRQDFRTAVAPVEYAGGWNVLAAIGLATSVLLADVFAFRADARAETLVPGGVLFVFVGALGDERLRIASAVLVVGVGVVTTVALRWYHAEPGRREAGSASVRWSVALAFGVVIALAAGFVGPRLPGADAAPLYETSGGGSGSSQTVSPLVDIQSRLTNDSTAELFRIDAEVASYWRLTALPDFDGTIWRPDDDVRATDVDQPVVPSVRNEQTITIGALGGTMVPAAPDPTNAPDILSFDEASSTLTRVDRSLRTGDVIDIVSTAPEDSSLGPEVVAAATSTGPVDPIYTDFPSDLPDVVEETARRVTSGARNTFERALLLENFFQEQFIYSLDIQSGHDNSAIVEFLDNRVGYCEQFAGTYAAMMRTLGIPARVAVGFTEGYERDDGDFSVIGRNAHAWPEVWFDGIGWLVFEPTPGRGARNAESYTGRTPQQDTSATADDVTDGELTPSTTVPLEPGFDQPGLEVPDFADLPPIDPGAGGPTSTTSGSDAGNVPWGWLGVIAALAAVVAAPALIRSVRRRRSAQTLDDQVATAWQRATDAVRAVGVPVRRSDTPLEVAATTAHHFPLVTRPMASLAEVVTEATYRSDGTAGYGVAGAYGSSTVGECRNWAKQIDRAATESLDWRQRLRRYFTALG